MKTFLQALMKNLGLTTISVAILLAVFVSGMRTTEKLAKQRHAEELARKVKAAEEAGERADTSPRRVIVERDNSLRRVGGAFGQ